MSEVPLYVPGARPGGGGRAWDAESGNYVTTLVIKAHRLLHHSTLGLRVIKKKKKKSQHSRKGGSGPLPSEYGTT